MPRPSLWAVFLALGWYLFCSTPLTTLVRELATRPAAKACCCTGREGAGTCGAAGHACMPGPVGDQPCLLAAGCDGDPTVPPDALPDCQYLPGQDVQLRAPLAAGLGAMRPLCRGYSVVCPLPDKVPRHRT